ncbi:MAG: PACE efflux transporter [Neisseria sp.]|nr:PACE efflux transporter [Neisseria sp.]
MQLQGVKRKVVQAILYETIAVLCVSPILALVFDKNMGSTTALSVVLSTLALVWSMVFNAVFEYWEARQSTRGRSAARRLLHAVGFEGGLIILFLPIVSLWLDISWQAALSTNMAMFVFFFIYAYVFQWGFDKVFGLPRSAQTDKLKVDA